jgi:hypothetical protein
MNAASMNLSPIRFAAKLLPVADGVNKIPTNGTEIYIAGLCPLQKRAAIADRSPLLCIMIPGKRAVAHDGPQGVKTAR